MTTKLKSALKISVFAHAENGVTAFSEKDEVLSLFIQHSSH